MAPTIHLTITAHGMGHLTRSLALAQALRALVPKLELVFSTPFPKSRLQRELPFAFQLRNCSYEPGTEQLDCFRTDIEKTRASQRAFFAERPGRLAEEESFLKQARPTGVISDIPALAIRAAANLGIPSVGVANFTWDWILEPILTAPPDREILDTLRADYASGLHHLKLPFGPTSSPFPTSETAPLISRRSNHPARETRAQLGIPETSNETLVLVCPGGWDAAGWEPIRVPDCAGYRFVMVGDLPITAEAPVTHLPHDLPAGIDFPDLVACADLVLAKPGYGMASECAAHQTPLVAIERPDFRETPVLLEQFGEIGRLSTMSLADFLGGSWRDALDTARADRSPWATAAEDPARAIALRLLELFEIERK